MNNKGNLYWHRLYVIQSFTSSWDFVSCLTLQLWDHSLIFLMLPLLYLHTCVFPDSLSIFSSLPLTLSFLPSTPFTTGLSHYFCPFPNADPFLPKPILFLPLILPPIKATTKCLRRNMQGTFKHGHLSHPPNVTCKYHETPLRMLFSYTVCLFSHGHPIRSTLCFAGSWDGDWERPGKSGIFPSTSQPIQVCWGHHLSLQEGKTTHAYLLIIVHAHLLTILLIYIMIIEKELSSLLCCDILINFSTVTDNEHYLWGYGYYSMCICIYFVNMYVLLYHYMVAPMLATYYMS